MSIVKTTLLQKALLPYFALGLHHPWLHSTSNPRLLKIHQANTSLSLLYRHHHHHHRAVRIVANPNPSFNQTPNPSPTLHVNTAVQHLLYKITDTHPIENVGQDAEKAVGDALTRQRKAHTSIALRVITNPSRKTDCISRERRTPPRLHSTPLHSRKVSFTDTSCTLHRPDPITDARCTNKPGGLFERKQPIRGRIKRRLFEGFDSNKAWPGN